MSKLTYQKRFNMAGIGFLAATVAMIGLTAPARSQDAPPSLSSDPTLNAPAQLDAGTGVAPPPSAAVAPTAAQGSATQPVPTFAAPPTDSLAPPAAPAASAAAAPAPSLSDILGQTANGQVEQPAALPPGFDLPIEQALPVEEKTKEEKELEMRQRAFDAAINGLFPLKPDEIRKLLERKDENTQAIEVPIYASPVPESAFATISLDPGEKPLEVKTAMGHVSTLSMVDSTGQPWPILDISWAGNFEVLQPENGSNMLRITPLSEFASGNVSMRMVGLNPPIILTFKADREKVHVRLDVQIPEVGPNGVAPLIRANLTDAAAGDGRLSSVLEGVAPAKAKKLTINGVDGRTSAYDVGGTMYVRTPYTLLSPAWNSSVRSADGTNVYALGATPVLLLSDKGKMVRAYLSGEEKTNGQ